MSVNELSAITANLGTILAGVIKGIQIFGSYIATSESYPRTEMDVTGNFLAAVSLPGTFLAITPQGFGNVPAVSFVSGGAIKAFINRSTGVMSMGTFDGEHVNLQASGSLTEQSLGGHVSILAPSGNITLNPVGNLQIGVNTGQTGTVFVSATSGGPANIPITFTKGIRTG